MGCYGCVTGVRVKAMGEMVGRSVEEWAGKGGGVDRVQDLEERKRGEITSKRL